MKASQRTSLFVLAFIILALFGFLMLGREGEEEIIELAKVAESSLTSELSVTKSTTSQTGFIICGN